MAEDFKTTWRDGFMAYAADMGKIYRANKEGMISCLKFDSVLDALNETYQLLIKENEIVRIEDLPAEKKNELWERAKKVDHNKARCIMICRAIFLLEKITA